MLYLRVEPGWVSARDKERRLSPFPAQLCRNSRNRVSPKDSTIPASTRGMRECAQDAVRGSIVLPLHYSAPNLSPRSKRVPIFQLHINPGPRSTPRRGISTSCASEASAPRARNSTPLNSRARASQQTSPPTPGLLQIPDQRHLQIRRNTSSICKADQVCTRKHRIHIYPPIV